MPQTVQQVLAGPVRPREERRTFRVPSLTVLFFQQNPTLRRAVFLRNSRVQLMR